MLLLPRDQVEALLTRRLCGVCLGLSPSWDGHDMEPHARRFAVNSPTRRVGDMKPADDPDPMVLVNRAGDRALTGKTDMRVTRIRDRIDLPDDDRRALGVNMIARNKARLLAMQGTPGNRAQRRAAARAARRR